MSDTLTIGQVMDVLTDAAPESNVYFDFCGVTPTVIDSWRGIYDEAALGYENTNHAITVRELLAKLREAVDGRQFFGYKGGEYTFNRNTRLHVDNYGECNSTILTRVEDTGYRVILHTEHSPD